MNTVKALMQFQLDGTGGLTIYQQNHGASQPLADEAVPNLYCITFIKKEGTDATPLGGIFIRTDLHHTSEDVFTEMVLKIAGSLIPSKNLVGIATVFKPTLLPSGSNTSDLEAFAATEFTKHSVQGAA